VSRTKKNLATLSATSTIASSAQKQEKNVAKRPSDLRRLLRFLTFRKINKAALSSNDIN
jgi:hypothetical protein